MSARPLTIGAVAQACGVNVETVRYYQRRGLISTPPKPARGFRTYPPNTVARIQMIKKAQALTFTLREIASLLTVEATDHDMIHAITLKRLETLKEDIEAMRAAQELLTQLVKECEQRSPGECLVLRSIGGK